MKALEILSSFCIVGARNLREPKEVLSFLKQYPVSGVALFNPPTDSDANIWGDSKEAMEVFHEFVTRVRPEISFFAVDQEGGRVQRLREPFARMPAAQTIGKLSRIESEIPQIYEFYRLAAQQLSLSEIRLNFAPVCDLSTEDSNATVIGDRSFGNRLDQVINAAKIFCEAFESEGVFTTLKHLPGHGSSAHDSHEKIAVLQKMKEEIKLTDFRIFQELAPLSSAVMTAHAAFPEDPERCFSIDKDLLDEFREALPTHLLWITDDLITMKAVSERKPWIDCFEAEYDFLNLCGTLDEAAQAIEDLIKHFESKSYGTRDLLRFEMKSKQCREVFASRTPKFEAFSKWSKQMKALHAKSEQISDSWKEMSFEEA